MPNITTDPLLQHLWTRSSLKFHLIFPPSPYRLSNTEQEHRKSKNEKSMSHHEYTLWPLQSAERPWSHQKSKLDIVKSQVKLVNNDVKLEKSRKSWNKLSRDRVNIVWSYLTLP